VPEIEVAERAGVGADGRPRPTEDHVAVLDNAVLLLDGATAPSPDLPSGGWYAGLLIGRLEAGLRADPGIDLGKLLSEGIAAVARDHGLRPGDSPSSTVAMARWSDDLIDGLVLADSPIVAFGGQGPDLVDMVDIVADDRLFSLRDKGKLRTGAAVREHRNTEGGFWVAEAEPHAASRAVRRSWPRHSVDAFLLASDGVSIGVDEYGLFGWPEVLALTRAQGTEAVLDAVRAAEEADPHGERWPRAKRHDDQALAFIDFTR
jgi:hypothetical protein